jgi:hypothetical protein
VTITGTAKGCPHPLYQFWLLAPGSSTWRLAQAYSTSPTFTWTTSGIVGGIYSFSVWARNNRSAGVSSDSLGSWDAYVAIQYDLTPTPCTRIFSWAYNSDPAPGTGTRELYVLADAMGSCPNPLFQFWLRAPGSSTWQLMQPYSTNISLVWTTPGRAKGVYNFQVWMRDVSSEGTFGDTLGGWDAYASTALQFPLS